VESDNLCGIYDERPTVCRVDDAYADYKETMTRVDFYVANAQICNALQESFGVQGVKKVIVLEK
jgi:Fe-S-cluster containining protein